jgi:hypothetical protein
MGEVYRAFDTHLDRAVLWFTIENRSGEKLLNARNQTVEQS